jgi:hypothetical protein
MDVLPAMRKKAEKDRRKAGKWVDDLLWLGGLLSIQTG